ncbi:poly-gamma-glutamate hydrolase family protein [Haloterrigena salifodinae]|uniref:Poly-gamma-glutamate hydrolase family protein n=1 Tax=Haloterrigena salifodinae TaxID=2675099 RepID=A0A8T8E480_9EURY|nr:poly-gamma-glutamate hydrolase family protein [Haloterrigena salifodinae]QRV16201.1 poly-gamma-glutamate hydrolase family protein [Haloterrigena salifodinae]
MTRATVRTHRLEKTDTGHYTELLYDDGANDEVLVCAAHGGQVEPWTAEQAIALTTRLPSASCWACLGYDDQRKPFELWHPPSSSFSPEAYPLLGEIADRGFETVVSFHGLGDDRVLVGGATDAETKRRVSDRLETAVSAPVESVSSGPYAGVSPNNFVNWLSRDGAGGLQLEQSRAVRDEERVAVVGALEALRSDGVL